MKGDKMRLTQDESRACPVTLKTATKHQVCLHRGGVCLHPLWTCPVKDQNTICKGICDMKKVDFYVKSKVYAKLAEIVDQLEDQKKWYVNEGTGEVKEIWAPEYAAVDIILDYLMAYK